MIHIRIKPETATINEILRSSCPHLKALWHTILVPGTPWPNSLPDVPEWSVVDLEGGSEGGREGRREGGRGGEIREGRGGRGGRAGEGRRDLTVFIVYDIVHDIVYDIVYDMILHIVYYVVCTYNIYYDMQYHIISYTMSYTISYVFARRHVRPIKWLACVFDVELCMSH